MKPGFRFPLVPLVVGALVGGLALAGLVGHPDHVVAWKGGEIWGHLWTWDWHGDALPAWPEGTDRAIGTSRWPVMDFVPALAGALLSRVAGVVMAWNLLAFLSISGAFWGGWFAARRAGGSGAVGGTVLAMGPVFTGGLVSGLSEDLAVGLLAAVVALAVVPGDSRRWALGLGGGLGLLAGCGLYLGWMAAGIGAAAMLAEHR